MPTRPYIIGIAGASCSGKTELATRLAKSLHAKVCTLDSYYRDLSHLDMTERARQNFDIPQALDEDLLYEQISAIARGEVIARPIYDFARHVRSRQTEVFEPTHIVIVEGLFTLYWQSLRDLLNIKVFIKASDDICLQRRTIRDIRERGRTAESVRLQFEDTVRPMTHLHINPTEGFADLVLDGNRAPEEACAAVLGLLPLRLTSG